MEKVVLASKKQKQMISTSERRAGRWSKYTTHALKLFIFSSQIKIKMFFCLKCFVSFCSVMQTRPVYDRFLDWAMPSKQIVCNLHMANK